jgi:hypothetical protein
VVEAGGGLSSPKVIGESCIWLRVKIENQRNFSMHWFVVPAMPSTGEKKMNMQTRIFTFVLFAFASVVLLAAPIPAAAQVTVIPVASGGDIQAAIDQAAGIVNGATPTDVVIEVAPGTYLAPSATDGFVVAAINSPTFTVTLRGSHGPAVTTIDASNAADFAIRGQGARNLVIDGFTVRNRIPDQTNFLGRGINLPNSTDITVENCHFDTTEAGVTFRISDPSRSSNVRVVNNTGVVGQGTDVSAPGFVDGQAASLLFTFPLGTNVAGESRFVVANNVFRCNASCVRYITEALDTNGNFVATFGNGSLVMTGNDVTSSLIAGFNILGGHAHVISGNRIHDGNSGGFFDASSGVIENNVIFNNAEHGLITEAVPTSQVFPGEDRVIRHNTIVNNSGTGIVYVDSIGTQAFLPNVYNNVIAFNDAGGVSSVVQTASTFAFIAVSFSLAKNDDYGNTLRNFGASFTNFNYIGISNPGAAAPNYSGVINTGLDLAVVPGFRAAQFEDFSLMPDSMLVNAGIRSRPTPFQDFAGRLRDAQPDIGAFEVVTTPVLNVRSNPLRKGPKDQ